MNFPARLKNYGLTAQQVNVYVFAPYRNTEKGIICEFYDRPVTRRELSEAFAALGLTWQWLTVTLENLAETIDQIAASEKFPLVLNYCDGDEVNGYPGISVVQMLEAKGIAFTGADAFFYALTTSKIPMKQAFSDAGVLTPAYELIREPADCNSAELFERLGAPLLLKPAVSAASFGLDFKSVVNTPEELAAQAQRLRCGLHGCDLSDGGLFVEKYIAGREFTVLVIGSAEHPETIKTYPVLERVFSETLAATERFLAFELNWSQDADGKLLAPDNKLYFSKMAADQWQTRAADVARQAFYAVGGSGYARVDLRMDDQTGQIFVLEVNANCGISSPDDDDCTVGRILELSGISFSQLLGDIFGEALLRFFAKKKAAAFHQTTIPIA